MIKTPSENLTPDTTHSLTATSHNSQLDTPDPNPWQVHKLKRLEEDLASGVAWHPAADDPPTPVKCTLSQRLLDARRYAAGLYLQTNGSYIDVRNKESRLNCGDVEKLIPQILSQTYYNHPTLMKNVGAITQAVMWSKSPDPRQTIGVYSGKAYPLPGNPTPRLYRNGMWDINTWRQPSYRSLSPSKDTLKQPCAFTEMLAFAIPDRVTRDHLLDWISWSLQHEGEKPNWSILLYSEEKGTGKSTIGEVLEALFGEENTAPINGIRKLTQRFAADVLSKKLIIAEEVHISSYSDQGNAIKDLITGERVTVEPKYQPAITIPQSSCFLFTTNHKPLWLEGGERRYYVIDMSHDGHAQGPANLAFGALVARVKEQINNPQSLRDLYERLMQRKQGPRFNPKNMDFACNATPIMHELQAVSGNEGEEVLNSLLDDYHVSIIPSSDFPELISHLKLRNANALRNMLSRLDWEESRLRLGGKQIRAWGRKGVIIQNKRIHSAALASTYEPDAVGSGYMWFDLEFYQHETWNRLRDTRLIKGKKASEESYSAMDSGSFDNSTGDFGPFKAAAGKESHMRYQTIQAENGIELK